MKSKAILIGVIGLIFLASCEKENEIENEIYRFQSNAKLKRILLFSTVDSKEAINIVEEYEYDSLGRIAKVSSPMYEDGEITGTIYYNLYTYNSNGQLERISNFNANINSPTGYINLKNYSYFYSDGNLKTKELIEYPQINSFEYFLYKYSGNQLLKAEKYDNSDQLESYTIYQYNHRGELTEELVYSANGEKLSVTKHTYENGLNTLTEVYSGNQENKVREINKTYDLQGNLIMLESNELMLYSSMMNYVLRYEYYKD